MKTLILIVLGLLVVGCNKKSQRTKDAEAAAENGRQELERMEKGFEDYKKAREESDR